jgi:serine/threonine protein phosphatase PrpC
VLKSLAVFDGHAQPACHGLAQGLLGWMLAREASIGDAPPET